MLGRINRTTETTVPRLQTIYEHPQHHCYPFPDPSLLDTLEANQHDEVLTKLQTLLE